MTRLLATFQALRATRDRGATSVEYGLMVALIAVMIIATITVLGTKLSDVFSGVAANVG
jgi:pilus assembly protein Flp/PilA